MIGRDVKRGRGRPRKERTLENGWSQAGDYSSWPDRNSANMRAKMEMREAAQAHWEDAIALYIRVMNDKRLVAATRMLAADKLLDRAFGKVPAAIMNEDGTPLFNKIVVDFVRPEERNGAGNGHDTTGDTGKAKFPVSPEPVQGHLRRPG